MAGFSPSLEGFRAAVRRPAFALGEITWRWVVGATATAMFFFGLVEYLRTLPVSNGELLFLRTRQPYLVAQAILHIFRGTLNRALMSAILAAMCMALLWMVAASLGRIAIVDAMRDYIREQLDAKLSPDVNGESIHLDVGGGRSTGSPFRALLRLNFLRIVLALAAFVGLLGAMLVAGLISPDDHPQPALAFLVFMSLAALVWLTWWVLNWLLSLAAMFAVRDRDDAVSAISAAVGLCSDRTAAVFTVSAWTGVAHLVAFVGATTLASIPLGFAGVLPGKLVVFGMILLALAYFAIADWLYAARLAGYVYVADVPDALLFPFPPSIVPPQPPVSIEPQLKTTIDRDEPILSDLPGLVHG